MDENNDPKRKVTGLKIKFWLFTMLVFSLAAVVFLWSANLLSFVTLTVVIVILLPVSALFIMYVFGDFG